MERKQKKKEQLCKSVPCFLFLLLVLAFCLTVASHVEVAKQTKETRSDCCSSKDVFDSLVSHISSFTFTVRSVLQSSFSGIAMTKHATSAH